MKKMTRWAMIVVAMLLIASSALADDQNGLSAYVQQEATFDVSFISQDVHEYGYLDVERIRHTTSTATFQNKGNTEDKYEKETGRVYRDVQAHLETFNANVNMNAQAGASVSGGASVGAGTVTATGNQQVSMNAHQNFSNGGQATVNYTGSTSVTATASK